MTTPRSNITLLLQRMNETGQDVVTKAIYTEQDMEINLSIVYRTRLLALRDQVQKIIEDCQDD